MGPIFKNKSADNRSFEDKLRELFDDTVDELCEAAQSYKKKLSEDTAVSESVDIPQLSN